MHSVSRAEYSILTAKIIITARTTIDINLNIFLFLIGQKIIIIENIKKAI